MPLVRSGQTIRVDANSHPGITADEWYELATEINFKQAAELQAYQSMRLNLERGAKDAGEGGVDELDAKPQSENMQIEFDLAGLQVIQLATYLIRWSHKQSINKQTVAHLDPVTASILLGVIRDLMAKQPGVMNSGLKKG